MFGKVLDKIQNIINTITGIMLFTMVCIVFVQVIMRYLMGHSISLVGRADKVYVCMDDLCRCESGN